MSDVKEELVITGNKVKKIHTTEEEFDVDVLLAEKEAELAKHIADKELYDAASDEKRKELQKHIRQLKKQL